MTKGKYKKFANRLVDAMRSNGHSASRSPNGICMKTLSEFAGASEQICRRYIRGDALPDYDKVINIAACLKVSPGWLLFGEQEAPSVIHQSNIINDDLMHYILKESQALYRDEAGGLDDYADFVMGLIREVREIDTSNENLEKIINLALGSISSYKEKRNKSHHIG